MGKDRPFMGGQKPNLADLVGMMVVDRMACPWSGISGGKTQARPAFCSFLLPGVIMSVFPPLPERLRKGLVAGWVGSRGLSGRGRASALCLVSWLGCAMYGSRLPPGSLAALAFSPVLVQSCNQISWIQPGPEIAPQILHSWQQMGHLDASLGPV